MSINIAVSEETYKKLEESARARGKETVEKLLEDWEDEQAVKWRKELKRRQEVGKRIKKLRERIFQEHGVMPDSTELIREDRNR